MTARPFAICRLSLEGIVATGCYCATTRMAPEYTVERTYKSLMQPLPEGGPYLSQEGDVFFVDEVLVARRVIRGWQRS